MSSTKTEVVPPTEAKRQPPSASVQRKLVRKPKPEQPIVKYVWIAGHVTTIVMGLIYGFYYVLFRSHNSKISFVAYRVALIGSIAAYSCTIVSQFNKKSLPSYLSLLCTLNIQYLLLGIVWFFNRSSIFKIAPYMIVSALQLATQFKVQPLLKLSHELKLVVAYDELLLFVVLLVDTILMRGTSGYALVIYLGFYWLRLIQSEDTRYLVYTIIVKLDTIMNKQKNPKVVEGWKVVKKFLTTKNQKFERDYLS
ncbi:DEKNAAC101834 [Brettanomyces naardenensis]|uniref:DEKNAAC101834 n=1 Tax=Brettanomyces naardenensis TaxID=13370 RepID=A0A448YJ87_BRENA|nr:DEKNAAC101834 [Brettanomyces naardenensis]